MNEFVGYGVAKIKSPYVLVIFKTLEEAKRYIKDKEGYLEIRKVYK